MKNVASPATRLTENLHRTKGQIRYPTDPHPPLTLTQPQKQCNLRKGSRGLIRSLRRGSRLLLQKIANPSALQPLCAQRRSQKRTRHLIVRVRLCADGQTVDTAQRPHRFAPIIRQFFSHPTRITLDAFFATAEIAHPCPPTPVTTPVSTRRRLSSMKTFFTLAPQTRV